MRPIRIAAALLAGSALLTAVPAFATEDFASPKTDTMGVSLTIVDQCLIGVDAPLAFPDHGILDEDDDASTTMTVRCTVRSPYTIGFSKGDNGADVAHRQMKSGTDLVNYQLSKDSDFSTNWTNTVGAAGMFTNSSATGSDETITVYGRVPSYQNVAAGNYTDTVTATIWYGDAATP